MKKKEISDLSKEYRIKYSLIEPTLKYDFEYENTAVFIKKNIQMSDFDEKEFERDLNYIADLYKAYEVRFEHAVISKDQPINNTLSTITYEELNDRMLTLMEEVGNLAKIIREMKKN